jgi:cytochrome P450
VIRKTFGSIAPGSLIVSEGAEWRRHRLVISPFFSKEQVEKYTPDMLDIIKEEYYDLATDKSFHLLTWTNMVVSRIIMKTLFNVNVNKKNEVELKRFNEAVHVMGDWVAVLFLSYLVCPSVAQSQYMKNYIKKKTSPFKQMIGTMKENPDPDCLWQQLEENGKFTWEEFENESVGLLFAAFETTSSVLCWILHTLSKFPSIKSKLKQEIDSTLHGKSSLTSKDLDSLPYLEKFILEALRYMVFIRMSGRMSIEQDSLGDYHIPQGFPIFESTGYIIRNAVENPDQFDPDRFNDENMKDLSKIVLKTFGTGPRACIGKHLALLEIKLIIVFILQQNTEFEVDTTNDYFNPHLPPKSPANLI